MVILAASKNMVSWVSMKQTTLKLWIQPHCRVVVVAIGSSFTIRGGIGGRRPFSESTKAPTIEINEDVMDSIRRYDKMIPRPQLIQDIMKAPSSVWLQEEFRIRCAERICMMEEYLPADFHTTIPQLEEVYQKHIQSFVDVRNAHYNHDTDSVTAFLPVVKRIVQRDKDIVPLMCSGMKELILRKDNNIDEKYTNRFLNEFFLNRIGSNVLMSQYLADATSGLHGDQKLLLNDDVQSSSSNIQNIMSSTSHVDHSIIDPQCNVSDVCRQVATQVTQLCYHETGFRPTIKVEDTPNPNPDNHFPYIPAALSYMVQEIMKNSAVATSRKYDNAKKLVSRKTAMSQQQRSNTTAGHVPSSKDMPISVIVSSDEQRVMIFIGDKAGGIPFEVGQHVWSWLYGERRRSEKGINSEGALGQATNLGGFGIGLPLSRLFASYLGGTINLISIPGYGTHAYIFLPRLPEQMVESVPIRANGWDSSKHSQVFIL